MRKIKEQFFFFFYFLFFIWNRLQIFTEAKKNGYQWFKFIRKGFENNSNRYMISPFKSHPNDNTDHFLCIDDDAPNAYITLYTQDEIDNDNTLHCYWTLEDAVWPVV